MSRLITRAAIASATLLLVVSLPARAQTTADKIAQAIALYQKFEIEAARPLLQEVLSPTWLQPVTQDERVQAYKYLGASYAVINKPDSAANYFVAALAYDAFTDLDRNAFTASELSAFDFAKTKIFKVGIKPLAPKVVNPKSSFPDSTIYNFRITTTQRAEITVTIVSKGKDTLSEEIFRGTSDGVRDIPWRGTIQNRLAPPGTYEFRVNGTSSLPQMAPQVEHQDLTIVHSFETLEDTLRTFSEADLLVEKYDSKAPFFDLIKGASLGIVAAAIPVFALKQTSLLPADKSSWTLHWTAATLVGIGAGLGSFTYRRSHLARQDAIDENNRRKQARLDFNRGVDQRNRAKLDQTKLIITPFGFTG